MDIKNYHIQPGTTLIEAGAGTGKTFTIQYLVLDCLLRYRIPITEILVVTYTEAATSELRSRLRHFLHEVEEGLLTPEAISEPLQSVLSIHLETNSCEQLLEVIRTAQYTMDEAPIHTLHGFCQRMLQEHAFRAGLSPEWNVVTDPSELIDHIVNDYLQLLNHSPLAQSWPEKIDHNSLAVLARRLMKFKRIKNPIELDREACALFEPLKKANDQLRSYRSEKEKIREEFASIRTHLNANSYNHAFWEQLEENLSVLLETPWETDAKTLAQFTRQKLENSFKKNQRPEQINTDFFDVCDAAYRERERIEQRCKAGFCTWFITRYQEVKAEQRLITFDDMILETDRLLNERSDLKEAVCSQFQAAIVDEFQDTDGRQFRIFDNLFGNDRDPSSVSNSPYFAMIGDPKQSIYSFRGADIATYLDARNSANHRQTLSTNYRSDARLVEGINQFFNQMDFAPAKYDPNTGTFEHSDREHCIPYNSVQAAPQGLSEKLVFEDFKKSGSSFEHLHMRPIDADSCEQDIKRLYRKGLARVVDDVCELLSRSKRGNVYFQTQEGDENTKRPLHLSDIAILVNAHSEGEELQTRLLSRGILAVRRKAGNVLNTAECRNFLHFLNACISPSDRYMHALLTSSLIGYERDEFEALVQHHEHEMNHYQEILHARKMEWRSGISIQAVWLRFLDEIGAREQVLSRIDGERIYTNYLHLGEIAHEMEQSEQLSPERLLHKLSEATLKAAENTDPEDSPYKMRMESDEDALQIQTIHSSKGLEYPVVFVPTLWQRHLQKSGNKKEEAIPAPGDDDCFQELQQIQDSDSAGTLDAAAIGEALRLGYVALTRAKHFCVYYYAEDCPLPDTKRSNHYRGYFESWTRAMRGGKAPQTGHECAFTGDGHTTDDSAAGQVNPNAPEPVSPTYSRYGPDFISRSSRISSFSSLTRMSGSLHARPANETLDYFDEQDPVEGEWADQQTYDETSSAGTAEAQPAEMATEDCLLEIFPSGARTGTCIHEILERVDFSTKPKEQVDLFASMLEKHFPDFQESRKKNALAQIERCVEMLRSFELTRITSSLPKSFSEITSANTLKEMEFFFPLADATPSLLDALLSDWAQRNRLVYHPMQLSQSQLEGFMTGSIDLFIAGVESYHILDWKTNYAKHSAGSSHAPYCAEGMQRLMAEGHYYLQALIYTVAASAFLWNRMPRTFDYDTHVAGFHYVFLRGLSQNKQTGWFHARFEREDMLRAYEILGLPDLRRK